MAQRPGAHTDRTRTRRRNREEPEEPGRTGGTRSSCAYRAEKPRCCGNHRSAPRVRMSAGEQRKRKRRKRLLLLRNNPTVSDNNPERRRRRKRGGGRGAPPQPIRNRGTDCCRKSDRQCFSWMSLSFREEEPFYQKTLRNTRNNIKIIKT